MPESPQLDKRPLVYVAATLVGVVIFVVWLVAAPHRVPKNTHEEITANATEFMDESKGILEQAKEARQNIEQTQQEWETEQVQKYQEQEEALEASKQELEAQGFRTTAPNTRD